MACFFQLIGNVVAGIGLPSFLMRKGLQKRCLLMSPFFGMTKANFLFYPLRRKVLQFRRVKQGSTEKVFRWGRGVWVLVVKVSVSKYHFNILVVTWGLYGQGSN